MKPKKPRCGWVGKVYNTEPYRLFVNTRVLRRWYVPVTSGSSSSLARWWRQLYIFRATTRLSLNGVFINHQ